MGHVDFKGDKRNSCQFLLKNLEVRDHWEYLGLVAGRIILTWILQKLGVYWSKLDQNRFQWWVLVKTE
jgi:hypothetical protein